jgi:hypothetical protein
MKKINKNDAKFEAVRFMREQRDRLSQLLSKMTKEEIVAYFNSKHNTCNIKPCV